jgi:hypothetical protein
MDQVVRMGLGAEKAQNQMENQRVVAHNVALLLPERSSTY